MKELHSKSMTERNVKTRFTPLGADILFDMLDFVSGENTSKSDQMRVCVRANERSK